MSFFAELKRRNVFRVAVAYVIATWLLLQVTDVLIPILTLPEWAAKLVFLILLVGFIPALIFAWAFEMTPDGIKKEKDVDRSQSITPHTGRKLDFAVIGLLVIGLGYFSYDKFVIDPSRDAAEIQAAVEVAQQADPDVADVVRLVAPFTAVVVL